MANYSDVLCRLNAYRKQKNLSKEAMAKMLGIYGNNYRQIETGKRMLSMENLKLFEKNGGNLFLLFTGQEQVDGPVEALLARCSLREQKKEIVWLLIAMIEYANSLEGNPVGQVKEYFDKINRLFDVKLAHMPMWERIRKLEFLNQIQMAELLEVETKRYRRIEKEEIAPDLGILCALQKNLDYSPQLFFDVEQFFFDGLNHYWNLLSERSQQCIFGVIESAMLCFGQNAVKKENNS